MKFLLSLTFIAFIAFCSEAQSLHPKNGVFIAYHKDTNLVAEYGNYKDDLKQGRWIKYDVTGTLREIYSYEQGIKKGHYKIFDVYGKAVREGYIEKGCYTGVEYIYENGKILKKWNYLLPYPTEETKQLNADLKSIKKIKESLYTLETAVLRSEGVLLNDKKDSLWLYYDDKGSLLAIENYKNGKRSGLCKRFHANNRIAETVYFEDGYMDGMRFVRTENGDTSEYGNYSGNKMDGYFVRMENVAVKDLSTDIKPYMSYGTYSKGIMNGKFTLKYPNNKIAAQEEYVKGMLSGERKLFYESGNLAYEGIYGGGKINGTEKKYYPNGLLRETSVYISGVKSGKQINYFENGKKSEELVYDNGKLKDFVQYYENGKIRQKRKYANGKEIGRESFDESGKKLKEIPKAEQLKLKKEKLSNDVKKLQKALEDSKKEGTDETKNNAAKEGDAELASGFVLKTDKNSNRKIVSGACPFDGGISGTLVSMVLQVSKEGNVLKAEPDMLKSSTNEASLISKAKQAALCIKFDACENCTSPERIEIKFHFK